MKTYKHKTFNIEVEEKIGYYKLKHVNHDIEKIFRKRYDKELIENSSDWVIQQQEELTYEMICEELKKKDMYIHERTIPFISDTITNVYTNLNAQIKLINCALYFNELNKKEEIQYYYYINQNNNLELSYTLNSLIVGEIRFNTKESAEMTLKLLGESVIRHALNLIN